MLSRVAIRLVIVSLFFAGCSLPGGGKTPVAETSTPEVNAALPTPTTRPVVTVEAIATDTPVPVSTLVPTETLALPAVPSPTPFPEEWYMVQPGTPLATYNIPHEAAGCAWLGVGGQVFGSDTAPVLGINILVGGTLDGHQVGSLGTTGMETNIGEGGYEITLADHPIDSRGTLWIQVVTAIGDPLSEKIYFDTVNDCERNFILVNFVSYTPPLSKDDGWFTNIPILLKQSAAVNTPVP